MFLPHFNKSDFNLIRELKQEIYIITPITSAKLNQLPNVLTSFVSIGYVKDGIVVVNAQYFDDGTLVGTQTAYCVVQLFGLEFNWVCH